MEKIQNQKHTKETLYYSISRMLERASYYGFRALVVLYMVGETLKMERTEALTIYGWLVGSLVFSQIIGGIFGDLLIGNKKSIKKRDKMYKQKLLTSRNTQQFET